MISLIGDFKSYPKKFKEIFYNYIRTQYNSVKTNKQI